MFGFTWRRLILLFLIIVAFYGGVQYMQMYFYATEFDDFIKDEVKFAPTREGTSAEHLTQHIASASAEYEMDVDPRQIRINKTHNSKQNFDTLTVEVPYTAGIDLSIYKPQFQFRTVASVRY